MKNFSESSEVVPKDVYRPNFWEQAGRVQDSFKELMAAHSEYHSSQVNLLSRSLVAIVAGGIACLPLLTCCLLLLSLGVVFQAAGEANTAAFQSETASSAAYLLSAVFGVLTVLVGGFTLYKSAKIKSIFQSMRAEVTKDVEAVKDLH